MILHLIVPFMQRELIEHSDLFVGRDCRIEPEDEEGVMDGELQESGAKSGESLGMLL